MFGSAQVGHLIGRQFGSYLGRQLALGACRDDRDDDLERRVFTPRLSRLPSAVDLRPWMTPVEDQGQLGSCAANALVGGLEYLVRRETGQHVDLSRLFVYFCQRLFDDCVREDVGASIADGVRVLSRLGVPSERSWPYHPDLFAVQPPRAVLREAAATRVVDWWSVPVEADAFRGCLAAGFPIAFGTRVTESFVQTSRRGECGMPEGALDPKHGRHALLAVGYDDARRVFVVRNSWGEDWGDRGYVYMPYAYVLNREWTSGCWALRLTARDAFDPAQHGGVDFGSIPKAPPTGGASGGAAVAGTVGSMGAQVAIGALTGSGLLAGLAGGLVSGLTPGIAKRLTRDRGAYAGEDLGDAILAAMRADAPGATGLAYFPWDDGLDEEAIVGRVDATSAERAVRASGRSGPSSSGASMPLVAPPASTPPSGFVGGAAGLIGGSIANAPAPAPAPMPPPPRPAPPIVAEPAMRLVEALPEPIAARWRREGGRMSPLGPPSSEPSPMIEGPYRGVVVRFESGWIAAWDGPPGRSPPPIVLLAREPCVAKWMALGDGRSTLGWPVSEVERAFRGRDEGSLLKLTRGSIVSHPVHGTFAIGGTLFAYWMQLGGLASSLGWPLEDERRESDVHEVHTQRFERGTLSWSPHQGPAMRPA
jgi:hypothetical protein